MRVLLINDFLIGGGAEVVFNKTYDVLIGEGIVVDKLFNRENIELSNSPFSYIYSYRSYNIIKRKLRLNEYDIIYILNYSYSFSPSILHAILKYKKYKNVKVIYNSHDGHIICPSSGLTYIRNKQLYHFTKAPLLKEFLFKKLDYRGHIYSILKKIQWLLSYKILHLERTFDLILSPSDFLKDKIKECYPNLDIQLLRNPLNIESIPSKQFTDNRAIPKLVYYGRLSNEKGLIPFLRSLSQVETEYSFDIYGAGPEKKVLEQFIKKNNLSNNVSLCGYMKWQNLMKCLKNYDIYVLPSLWPENAPLSIVEAAAAGLYIWTMNYGGMRELASLVGNYSFINPLSTQSLNHAFSAYMTSEKRKGDLLIFTEERFKDCLVSYIKC